MHDRQIGNRSWYVQQYHVNSWSAGLAKDGELNGKKGQVFSGQDIVASIILTNVAIFLGWKVRRPSIQRYMLQNFAQHLPPSKTAALTLVYSAFSHMEIWHLGANMWALWSFGRVTALIQGAEQFMAFYMSAAAVSSLAGKLCHGP